MEKCSKRLLTDTDFKAPFEMSQELMKAIYKK